MITEHANVATAGASAPITPMTHWDHVAETTSWGRYLSDIERKVILRGEALAPTPKNAIDMGCGGGRWSKLLAERGWNLTSSDVSSEALAICQRNVPHAHCHLASKDSRTIPARTNAAGLLLCIEVVPLIESNWFIPEAHRVLVDGGIFVGVYINGRSLRGVAWRVKQRLSGSQETAQFYKASYIDWKNRLTSSGFEMVHEESCCWGPFTRNSNSPLVPVFTKFERAVGLHRVVNWSPWVVFIARKVAQ